MLTLFLKWMTIALAILTVFSAMTALYGLYELNIGACSEACDNARTFTAYTYIGLVGLLGFGVSAYAAHTIAKSFEDNG